MRELLADAALLCVRTLLVWSVSTAAAAAADDVARLQSAVVKVTSNIDGLRATGAGVIVKVEPDTVFILSATHVVRGDKYPLIEFFSRRNVVVEGDVVERDKEKDQGLVLLVVRGKELRVTNRVPDMAGVGGICATDVAHGRQVIAERQPGAWQIGLEAYRVAQRFERFIPAPGACQGYAQFQMRHCPVGLGHTQWFEGFHCLPRLAARQVRGAQKQQRHRMATHGLDDFLGLFAGQGGVGFQQSGRVGQGALERGGGFGHGAHQGSRLARLQ